MGRMSCMQSCQNTCYWRCVTQTGGLVKSCILILLMLQVKLKCADSKHYAHDRLPRGWRNESQVQIMVYAQEMMPIRS